MTEVVNVPDLDLQFFGNDGKPMASGHVVFFRNGTDIPAPVFTSDGETSLGNTIELDASGFPNTQFSLKAGQLYTVKAFNSDNVLIWTRNDISGSSEGGGAGNWVPIEGTSLTDPMTGPLVIKYDDKTTTLDNETLQSDTGMQVVAPDASLIANNGLANVIGTPRVSINAVGADSAQIYVQSDKKIEMQGTQIEIKAPNSGNEITINSKGLTEVIGGVTSVQGNNGLTLYGGGTGITINGAAKFLSTATLKNKTVNDIWTSSSTGAMTDDQLITAKAAYDMSQGGGGGSGWTSVCGLSSHYLQSNNAFVNVYFSFTPLGPTVRSILIPYAHFSYSKNVTAKIAVWKCGAFNGGVTLGTPIAEKSFTQAIKHPLTWFDFDTDVDVSDKTANYIFGYSTNSPDNGYVKIISDDSSADNNFGLVSYQMKANNSWDSSYPLWYGGKRSMAFGLSSVAQNS